MSTQEGDVVAAVRARLQTSPYRAVRQLSCEIMEDALILQGRVSTYHEKQQAQEIIRTIQGVPQIVNEVTVVSE